MKADDGDGCACMDRCRGTCGLKLAIADIRRTVESMLPEDEPDCTAAWVYRVAIEACARPSESQKVKP